MIKGNTIYFGYGDIAVNNRSHMLCITPINPPQDVGSVIDMDKVEVTGPTIKFPFRTLKEVNNFIDNLFYIYDDAPQFTFQDYIFDFTNYKSDSIGILLNALKAIKCNLTLLMAC